MSKRIKTPYTKSVETIFSNNTKTTNTYKLTPYKNKKTP